MLKKASLSYHPTIKYTRKVFPNTPEVHGRGSTEAVWKKEHIFSKYLV